MASRNIYWRLYRNFRNAIFYRYYSEIKSWWNVLKRDKAKTEQPVWEAWCERIYPAVINSYFFSAKNRNVVQRFARSNFARASRLLCPWIFRDAAQFPAASYMRFVPGIRDFFRFVLPLGYVFFLSTPFRSLARFSPLLGEPKLILMGIFMALGQRRSRTPVRLESHW